MVRTKKLRQMLESFETSEGSPAKARLRFVEEIHTSLGLLDEVRDKDGNLVECVESKDNYGRPVLAKDRMQPDEYSIRNIAEAIFGDQFDRHFNPEEAPDRLTMLESGIDPTAFININTFTLATSGLVQARVLERFNNPAFIGDQLVEVRNTKLNGEKMIGLTGIGNKSSRRKPGQPHPRAGFGERWVETPELEEEALACEVRQESVFYDLTGQVLDEAGAVGEELGYKRELEILRLVMGATNSYNYMGTAYDTYQGTTPWINDHANVMQDHTDLDNSDLLFQNLKDPHTLKEILVMPTTILHMPTRAATFHRVLNSTELRETTNTNTVTIAPPMPRGSMNLLSSPIAYSVAQAATAGGLGLGLSASDAKEYWWRGDFKKAFAWMEAWPIRVRQASASEYTMLDHGIIAAYFSNYRGIPAVKEPRYAQRNKAS